ncbi:MAG: TetR/AcrR family transcriptional regulator [Bacteroidota bacterium]
MPRVKLFDEKTVLEKAMCLFWKKGYYATSVQDLVNHLGINRASLYDTYGGKKQLFKKAFSHYQNTNVQLLQQFLDQQENTRAGLQTMFAQAIQESQTDKDRRGCFVVNTTIEFIPNEIEMLAVLKAHQQRFEQIFFNYLAKGVERGDLPPGKDLKAIAALLFTYYNGLRVITKVTIDPELQLQSINSLLSVLD